MQIKGLPLMKICFKTIQQLLISCSTVVLLTRGRKIRRSEIISRYIDLFKKYCKNSGGDQDVEFIVTLKLEECKTLENTETTSFTNSKNHMWEILNKNQKETSQGLSRATKNKPGNTPQLITFSLEKIKRKKKAEITGQVWNTNRTIQKSDHETQIFVQKVSIRIKLI